ncbi:MAG: flavin reductase family protein [Bacteroidales bacterium]|nr:flavin reductase family protein [Bacteroidales bacterium]
MKKVNKKPAALIYPVPAAMVSCGSKPEEHNIITIAWTGTINSIPPMCYVSIRKERYSYDIIKRNMEFVINYSTKDLVKAADFCGRKSGRDCDKFKEMNLTSRKGEKVDSTIIVESPINIECKVTEIKELGSHDMFLAEVVNIQVSENYIDQSTGAINMQHQELMAYSHGKYIQLGDIIEQAGFSIKSNK